MKKPTLLYIPLLLLFALAMAVLSAHYGAMLVRFDSVSGGFAMPFTSAGSIIALRPEAEQAGLKLGDKLVAVNGRKLENEQIYLEELAKARADEDLNFTRFLPTCSSNSKFLRALMRLSI